MWPGYLLSALAFATACGPATAPPDIGPPPGAETDQPFPIDRGDDGPGTPGSYKSLWLRLVERPAPIITPVDGVIGLVCVGMSNANQECDAFIEGLGSTWAGTVSAAVRVVNCAVGGHAIERWNDPGFDPVLWDSCLTRKGPAAGVRPDQVRVVYHKAANQFTTGAGGAALPLYPDPTSDYAAFRANLTIFAGRVKVKFPAVQAVYTSSRSYGGYAANSGRGEPLSYEEGHALNRWLDEYPEGSGVWYGWGPYLWAPACATGVTNLGGVCYDRGDYQSDGVHPSVTGEQKTSGLLHARLLREPWYRR